MTVAWTQHRFSGGVLALDTTNTVVHRCDPSRRFDRFDDPPKSRASRPRPRSSASRKSAGRWRSSDAEAIAETVRESAGIDRCAVSPAGCRRAARCERAGDVPARLRRGARRREELLASADAPFGEAGVATAVRDGAGGLGAVAAQRRQSQESEGLSELHLAVSGQKPQFQPLVVRYGGLRKPGEGEASLSPSKTAKGENRWLESCCFR